MLHLRGVPFCPTAVRHLFFYSVVSTPRPALAGVDYSGMRTLRGSADFRGFGSRFPRIDLVVRGSEKNRSIRLVRKWHAYPQIGGRQFAHLGPEVTLAPAHNGRCTRRASSSPRYRQLFRPRLCQPVEMAMGRSES